MHYINDKLWFPDPSEASEEGIIALGGDLTTARLMLAYNSGIFPWYEEAQPIIWWCPIQRMVLFPKQLKVSRSLRKTINANTFEVTFNKNFSEVIKNCATIKRDGQRGTWITLEMQRAYQELHRLGHAISVEVWQENQLVGGLYGIDLPEKKVFCGESMFSKVSDASKVGFVQLVKHLSAKKYRLIDCQIYTQHLENLGATEISRREFLKYLKC